MSFINEKATFDKFGNRFQEDLVHIMIDDRVFCDQISEVMDTNFLELKYLRVFVEKLFEYRKKYVAHPSRDTLTTILRTELDKENELLQKQIREFFARVQAKEFSGEGSQHIKDVSLDFCKKQKLKEAMIKSVGLIQNSSYDEVSKIINDALKLGTDNNNGYDFIVDFEKRFEHKARNPVTTNWELIDKITKGGLGKGELGVVIAPTGCHAKGTKILLHNGKWKNVEDIVIGDKVMGPDSTERIVKNLHRGQEEMYEISPVKGKPFVVNSGHILSLTRTDKTSNIANISVSDYLKTSKTFKHLHKLYRPETITFNNNNKKVLYPYIVGALLGDGSLSGDGIVISCSDESIIEEVKSFAQAMECNLAYYKKVNGSKCMDIRFLSGKNNKVWEFVNRINLAGTRSGDKFIPEEYKFADVASRLELLAGLIDTDGSLSNNCFDYISKSKQLSEDVVFLCQSLGLAAYMKPCRKADQNGTNNIYYRVSISGNIENVPVRVHYKKAAIRKQVKSVLRTGFSVEPVGIGEYYGFEVNKDNLYVMEDFFVTHNSGKSMVLVHLGAAALKAGKNVVHYTLELQDKVVALRYDSCLTGVPISNVVEQKDIIWEGVKDIPGKLLVKEYPTKMATTTTIRNHLEKLRRKDFKVDLVIIDYGDLLRPVSSQKEKRNELESIYEEMRGIAQSYDCPVWTASQTNRSGINAEVITMESISEAFNKCFVADFIFTVSRTIRDKNTNEGRIYVAKNRNGPDGIVFPIFMDTSNVKIKVLSESTETATEIMENAVKRQEKDLKKKYSEFRKEKN